MNKWIGHSLTINIISLLGTTWQSKKALTCAHAELSAGRSQCFFWHCQLNLRLYPGAGRMTSEADREIGHGLSEADFLTQRGPQRERQACEFTAIPDSTLKRLPALGILCGCRARVIKPGLDTFERAIGGGQIVERIRTSPDRVSEPVKHSRGA